MAEKKRRPNHRLIALMAAAVIMLSVCGFRAPEPSPAEQASSTQADDGHAPSGKIYLYGELHSDEFILDMEFALWDTYYHDNGMRDLFIEYPYYSAEFLNLWMVSEDDGMLDELFRDLEGTAAATAQNRAFYERIKEECPETLFHGTDVGHQYDTTGARYLAYLEQTGQEDSPAYLRTQAVIEQGKRYYLQGDDVYRETMMAKNFILEYMLLDGADVMGIYGAAHTGTDAMDFTTGAVPSMANQLAQHFGEALHAQDLSQIPRRVDTLELGGKTYTASYFGRQDLSSVFPQYQCREYWRLDDAYEDFKDCPAIGETLPYNNYPMSIEEGQVFVIDYTLKDGSVERRYYRSDGNVWQDRPTTEGFSIDD